MADGYTVASAVSDAEFAAVCTALGAPEIADDPRWAKLADRMRNAAELGPTMRELALNTTVADFVRRAEEADAPGAPVLKLHEVPDDAQIRHNGVFVERNHPVAGRMREPRPAPRFSATPAEMGAPTAIMGQHSDDVVWEAGFDPDELRAANIIA
jgi:crotonobetainyl-CoA:carnitine CoA-transferase CaiB-like acyl-CoA transferase